MDAFLGLPFEILIPNTLFEDELLKFTAAQKKGLLRAGLKVIDIPGPGVLRAREIIIENPYLSVHDGLAFVLAESHTGCILLTGDGRLRALAAKNSIDVHGVLWVVDQIHKNGGSAAVCHRALLTLSTDPAVRLPQRELAAAIKRFGGFL
jgi:hypothetical protein